MCARVLVVHIFSSGVMVGRGTIFITKGALRIKYCVGAIFCLPRGCGYECFMSCPSCFFWDECCSKFMESIKWPKNTNPKGLEVSFCLQVSEV